MATLPERRLPAALLERARVSPGGEHAWRLGDIEEAIEAARALGLATVGGQVQFQPPEGTWEPPGLSYVTEGRLPGEPWAGYVGRSADEALAKIRALRAGAGLRAEALAVPPIREAAGRAGADPLGFVWLVLYVEAEG